MKTKIRVAGGSYGEEGKVIWSGDLPLVDNPGTRVLDETSENGEVIAYTVSQIAVHFNSSEMWQTLFVIPIGPTGRIKAG
jgi:hypothetical protein